MSCEPEPCEFCGKPSTHILDEKNYCCACFDDVIEHSGNVKMDSLGAMVKLAGFAVQYRTPFYPKK